MKRQLIFILALAALIGLLACGAALADNSCGDNVTYTVSRTGVLTISGTGATYDYGMSRTNLSPFHGVASTITSIVIEDGVTGIGSYIFVDLTDVTSVILPTSVASIGQYAFYRCTGLTSVTVLNPDCAIGDDDYDVFKDCASGFKLRGWPGSTAQTYAANTVNPCAFESLGSLSGSCGANVTYSFNPATGRLTISGTGAMEDYGHDSDVPWFIYRDCITSAVIENGVTGIGYRAFWGCTGLTSVTIPDGLTSIGGAAFYQCTGLTSITIPASVTSIGYGVFCGCTGLTSVTIPNSVTSIGYDVFYGCTGLTSVTIPNSVTSIGYWAFYDCTSLTSVTIPNSVTSIDYLAFWNCTGLTSVTVLNPDCTIGDSDYDVFEGCASGFTLRGWPGSTAEAYAGNTKHPCAFELLAPAPDLFLPAALTSIEQDAFQGIAAEAVVIPKNIQTISGNPFAESGVLYIYGFPGTAAETLAQSDPIRFMFFPLTDAWYARLTD